MFWQISQPEDITRHTVLLVFDYLSISRPVLLFILSSSFTSSASVVKIRTNFAKI